MGYRDEVEGNKAVYFANSNEARHLLNLTMVKVFLSYLKTKQAPAFPIYTESWGA